MPFDPSASSVICQDKKPSKPIKAKRHSSRFRRSWRYFYLRFLRLRGTPGYISRGLACGVFAGCFPLFGLQTLIGVLLAVIFRGHKLTAAAGTWISNPLTYVPIFAFNYKIGELLLGLGMEEQYLILPDDWQSWSELKAAGLVFLITLFFGCFVVGLLVSVVAYIMSVKFFSRWHKKRYQTFGQGRRQEIEGR